MPDGRDTPDRAATGYEVRGTFECKTCGWLWTVWGRNEREVILKFDHTCTGPTIHA